MKLYLSGPMSGIPDHNFPAFFREARALEAAGYEVVNPAEINVDQSASWEACLKADIKQLVDCDGVAVMEGWTRSRGATLECYIAEKLNLPVREVGMWILYPFPRKTKNAA